MDADRIRFQTHDGVAAITLDRPKANAIDSAMSKALAAAFARVADDDSIRVAILTGAGERFFSGGWDMNEAASGVKDIDVHGPGGFAGIRALHALNKPVIAAVNGLCIGGAWELALACDIVVAAEGARFWSPEVQRGFAADAGGAQNLQRYLPRKIAAEVLLTGRWFELEEAHAHGLVNHVVTPGALMSKAMEMARSIAANAPLAVQATKEIMRWAAPMAEAAAIRDLPEAALPAYRRMMESEDFFEGPRAFTEKRGAAFKGD